MIYEQLTEGIHTKCEDYLCEDNTGAIRRTDLLQWLNSTFPLGWNEDDAALTKGTPSEVADRIIARVREMYEKKVEGERPDRVDSMERSIMLQSIDKLWQQHIMDMDALREGVRLRAQGQRDPLVEYKREAYGIFEALISSIQYEILNNLFRSTTSLDAFEDFLSSLPESHADEESPSISDLLGKGDILSALREQMALMQKRYGQQAAAPQEEEVEENTVDLPLTEDLNMDMSVSGAPMPGMRMKPEKKMVLPRKKVTAKIKRQDSSAPLTISSADLADAAPGVAFSGQELDVQESTSGNGDEKLS
jgi:preprotein translocase subunit SecA